MLSTIALEFDDKFGLKPGTCLFIAKHMIANKKWLIDMNKELKPLSVVDIQLNPLNKNLVI
jgi:hypothetical protein